MCEITINVASPESRRGAFRVKAGRLWARLNGKTMSVENVSATGCFVDENIPIGKPVEITIISGGKKVVDNVICEARHSSRSGTGLAFMGPDRGQQIRIDQLVLGIQKRQIDSQKKLPVTYAD